MKILLPNIAEIVKRAIESFSKQKLLSNLSANKLIVDDVRTMQFHILLKFHKPNIPRRPAVSSIECHTSKISKFIDHFLQPHAKSLPSYVKDTLDFIYRINETKDIQKDTILVKFNVKSVYTEIPKLEGVEAAKKTFRSRTLSMKEGGQEGLCGSYEVF